MHAYRVTVYYGLTKVSAFHTRAKSMEAAIDYARALYPNHQITVEAV